MSIKLMAQVWESDLPPTPKFILSIMANFAYDEDGDIFPSVNTISKLTSYSERTVQYAIKDLVADGYLFLMKAGTGLGHTNHYKINCERLKGRTSCTVYKDEKGATDNIKGATDNIKGATDAPESLLTLINLNTTPENKNLTVEKHREATMQSLVRGAARHHGDEEDRINQYPEDVRVVITAVCDFFHLKCPSIKSKHAGQWVSEARELKDACGEFEKLTLSEIANDFERHMRLKGGTVPFPVSGPRSLVNMARAKAGELRAKKTKVVQENFDGYAIPKGAARVYSGGKVFVPGIGEVTE